MTHARAIVTRSPGEPLVVEDVELDPPGRGEVRVRILANGLCHSDYSVYHGRAPERLPGVLGHEAAGVIEAVGATVDTSRVGERVVIAWRAPCGICRFCAAGQLTLCTRTQVAEPRLRTRDGLLPYRMLGIGSLSTHVVVAAAQCIAVPVDVAPEHACLIGCAVMTGVGAALYTANVQPASTVAVFGCGGVGTSVIQGARIAGAARILAVDVDPRKLA
ncbi:MAG TPA: alcohol dehydrogenase catalytic domain-containing protein, partial [Chloroflexota bacterium]|nr:alcohol dehydrogenase catalytic domain-containing protein [Chloroflexota bacterium]